MKEWFIGTSPLFIGSFIALIIIIIGNFVVDSECMNYCVYTKECGRLVLQQLLIYIISVIIAFTIIMYITKLILIKWSKEK